MMGDDTYWRLVDRWQDAQGEKIWRYIARKNDKGIDPTIRQIARTFNIRQSVVHGICEDMDLCINVGFATGNGYAEFDTIGDYTVEILQ